MPSRTQSEWSQLFRNETDKSPATLDIDVLNDWGNKSNEQFAKFVRKEALREAAEYLRKIASPPLIATFLDVADKIERMDDAKPHT